MSSSTTEPSTVKAYDNPNAPIVPPEFLAWKQREEAKASEKQGKKRKSASASAESSSDDDDEDNDANDDGRPIKKKKTSSTEAASSAAASTTPPNVATASAATATTVGSSSAPSPTAPTMFCKCKTADGKQRPAGVRTVENAEKENYGRQYYHCDAEEDPCSKFIYWVGVPLEYCNCKPKKTLARYLKVKKETSKDFGKNFWCCAKDFDDKTRCNKYKIHKA